MARYNRASPPMVMSFEVKGALSLISIRHDIPPNVASPVSVDVVRIHHRRGGLRRHHHRAAASGSFALYSSTRALSPRSSHCSQLGLHQIERAPCQLYSIAVNHSRLYLLVLSSITVSRYQISRYHGIMMIQLTTNGAASCSGKQFVTTAAASSPTSTSSTGSTRPLPVATAPLSRCTASRRSASYFNSSPQRPGGTHHFEHVVGGAF